ncbi:MAG: hypothetical protein IKF70_04830, partial [Firmicutes bacterium]|nr:hypothetical protein [Bacillota bacterium]
MTFNHKLIVRTVSVILLIEGLFMLPSLILAWHDGAAQTFRGFLWSFLAVEAAGIISYVSTQRYKVKMKIRESYYVVIVC